MNERDEVNQERRHQGVNFINGKHANFLYKRRFSSIRFGFDKKFVRNICVFNIDEIDTRSISPTFYVQLLYMQIPKAQTRLTG